MKMTEKQHKKKCALLKEKKTDLEETLKLQQIAAEEGDLKENEEYHTARTKAERLLREISVLESEIADATIVASEHSNRINLGSDVEIWKVDEAGKQISEARRFTLEASGDTITQKILGVNSSLGKAILNGTDGIYVLPDNGGIRYFVRKVID